MDGLLPSELPFLTSRATGKATLALVSHFLCVCVEVVSIRKYPPKEKKQILKALLCHTTLLSKVQLAGHLFDMVISICSQSSMGSGSTLL